MNLNDITCVEVLDAPVRENRFLTYFGNVYGGPNDLQFVPMSRVIRKNAAGDLAGDKSLSINRKIVDDVHAHAASGQGAPYLASARVLKYLPSVNKWEIVYEGKEKEVKNVEPTMPKVMLAFDHTWRVVPTKGFTKGSREWAYIFAHVDRQTNVGYNDRMNGATKLECVTKLFESSIPWIQDYVRTFDLADAADIPAPPAPIAEKVYSQQELDQVAPLDPLVWNVMPKEEFKRKYLFDELFRVSYEKMVELEQAQKAQAAERQRKLDKDAELKRMKDEYLKKDADEARKGRGVGTIL